MLERFKPILERNGVHAYFAGHDHDLQLFKDKNIYYIISGGGSRIRRVAASAFTRFKSASFDFVLASIDKKRMILHFINEKRTILYSYEISAYSNQSEGRIN